MLEVIRYPSDSHIRLHITLADASVCEDDILERYGVSPEEKTVVDSVYLDPGGFTFTDTDFILFDVHGVPFSIKPEHLYSVDDLPMRMLGEDWVKVYLDGACLVLPAEVWFEASIILKELNKACPDGRGLLTERMEREVSNE